MLAFSNKSLTCQLLRLASFLMVTFAKIALCVTFKRLIQGQIQSHLYVFSWLSLTRDLKDHLTAARKSQRFNMPVPAEVHPTVTLANGLSSSASQGQSSRASEADEATQSEK